MADYAPSVKRLLLEAGCEFVRRGRGDHEIWRSTNRKGLFVVDSKIKSRHTANKDGPTYSQAMANIERVMSEWIDTARELGREIPLPMASLAKR